MKKRRSGKMTRTLTRGLTHSSSSNWSISSNLHDELTNSIRLLNTLAIKLKAKRMAAGALNLASPEVKIHLDSAESSDPIDVEQKELRETNSLVEEFMLLANISVARKIEESFPQTAVLRSVHFAIVQTTKLTFRAADIYLPLKRTLRSYKTSCARLRVSLWM